MKKLASIAEGNMVLKYQLISEDLDALITVKSDEDILHMLEEYDRYKLSSGRPKLRAYLFPSTPIIPEHHDAIDARSPEERYIDAVNGFSLITRQHSLSSDRPDFFIGFNSSAGSFPKSTESTKIDTSRLESITPTFGYPKDLHLFTKSELAKHL
ncbi:unnamed protein product [Thlaspi arvense]|uniref:PB1 domain-containing protein n=1 Tax=Thlaspi arvense TaxID=13288 RepID=A0AAU9SPA6_THLAR|nr:unnamed protein product [Thlaspi arvense]